ncbi:MAG: hypothetical protein GX663_06145 [Clostridiales bacterium]|nr:hypothetical protein [Clostridiales bacterium]
MGIDDIKRTSLLCDFYGRLLTERQREVMRLYHEENLSLSEIAAEFAISRQGVHDALKNAERYLKEYEGKMGLVERFQRSSQAIREIDVIMDRTISSLANEDTEAAENAARDLKEVKDIIDKLEE